MIIDAHLHVFKPATSDYPRAVDNLVPADREAPVEDLLAVMAGAGVDRAVLVPLGPEDRYVAECRAAYPDRFVSIGVADDDVTGRTPGVAPLDALDRRATAAGFSGLRMNWLGDPATPVTESPAWPTLRYLAEHGLVVWFYAPPDQLPLLDQALTALPDLRVVLNHLGFCPPASGSGWELAVDAHRRPRIATELPPPTLPDVLALARHPGVRVHFSGQYAFTAQDFPYTDLAPIGQALYAAFGADRLMWASDYPWVRDVPGYARLPHIPEAHLPGLTRAELDAVRGGTAERLFTWG